MNKYMISPIFTIIAVVVVVILFFLLSDKFRKDLPFQEIVPLNQGIAVINSQKWFMDQLEVICVSPDGTIQKGDYDLINGVWLKSGLTNGAEYLIRIRRTDLKGMLLYKEFRAKVKPVPNGARYYILVGASIGKTWDFPKLAERLGLSSNIVFGNRTIYNFDKSQLIKELIELPVPIAGVIVKECSAYFPRDLATSKIQIMNWVNSLRQHNIQPILATTVPVTESRAFKDPGKQEAIMAFNDFVRQFSKQEKIALLDLEKVLRVNEADRHLSNEYAQQDGAHLNDKAYSEALDQVVMPALGIVGK